MTAHGTCNFLTQGEEMDKLMDIEPKKAGHCARAAVWVFVWWGVLISPQATLKSQNAKADASTCSWKLCTPRSEYLLGEAVLLGMRFTNRDRTAVRVREFRPEESVPSPSIHIKTSEGWVGLRLGLAFDCTYGADVLVASGECWCHSRSITAALRPDGTMPFSQPGSYTIRLGDETAAQACSLPLEITIKQPEGNDAAMWLRLQRVPNLLPALYATRGPDESQVRRLLALLDEFPNNGYKGTILLALQRSYAARKSEHGLDTLASMRRRTGLTV
jgi:hypothetical protein